MKHLVTSLFFISAVSVMPSFAAEQDAVKTVAAEVIVPETLPAETVISAPEVASGAAASAAASQLPVDIKVAADIAIEAFGGEVVKAEEIQDESGLQFNIRVVNDGRVKDVVVDAANGDIIKPLEVKPVEAVTDVAAQPDTETVEAAQ